jgi:hypothetical protein
MINQRILSCSKLVGLLVLATEIILTSFKPYKPRYEDEPKKTLVFSLKILRFYCRYQLNYTYIYWQNQSRNHEERHRQTGRQNRNSKNREHQYWVSNLYVFCLGIFYLFVLQFISAIFCLYIALIL